MLLIWIPVSLASNGRDTVTEKETETASGSSERHLGAIGEALEALFPWLHYAAGRGFFTAAAGKAARKSGGTNDDTE